MTTEAATATPAPEEAPAPQPPTQQQPAPSRAAMVAVGERGIMIRNLEDLLGFAAQVVRGGAAPSWAYGGMDRDKDGAFDRARGAVAIAIQAGLEHGLGVLGGLQAFMVLDGNLSWKAEYAAGKIRNSPACKPGSLEFWCDGDGEARKGVAVAWRVGDPAPSRREFTFQDARTAGLLDKKNWRTYPKRMYQWRALSWLAKDKFSDVLGGMPLAEEVMDFVKDLEEERPRTSKPAIVQTGAPALPEPSAPDPLFGDLKAKRAPEPVPVTVSPAEEPGAEEGAQAFTDAPEPEVVLVDPKAPPQEQEAAPGCNHPNCPPSRVADATARGKSIHCPDCGEELAAEPPPPELELSAPKPEPKPAPRRSSKRL